MPRLRESPFFLASVAATLSAGILWALALAASAQLHEALHHDAGNANHQCVATMFQHGACEKALPANAVPVLFPPQLSHLAEVQSQEVPTLFLLTCVLEHAPPLFS